QPVHDCGQGKLSRGYLPPVCSRKYVDALQVGGLQVHHPPLRIRRQFAPHGTPAAEQQSATQRVLALVRGIRVHHQLFEPVAIAMELLQVKLVLQEFRNHLCFAGAPDGFHAASCRAARGRRKNGTDTSMSMATISTNCTSTTSRRSPWKT